MDLYDKLEEKTREVKLGDHNNRLANRAWGWCPSALLPISP